ncbi:nitroreductase/quinone reductase family protein [Amycolatopsis pithecellobii]|uniref:Nitroreductase family deazaflavin-dependent oxidoreductase n=1 Tax=Amycolatopsis pithecellobii TaxID=664692 RepID=A0A6N7YU54_9PSEU|nr:nitroreductase/quinone reductase family protein [Amycolatopsis pithecellobii]MTD55458.1 nitroreductase family deazaflavin-dependent oxidoreductase [Amycolatopsis pithecellobii]
MSDIDLNQQVIAEFRASGGRVGGHLEGVPVVILHHRGRSSGREYVHPVVCLVDADDANTVYVFGTNGGQPTSPQWYRNLTAAGTGTVETASATYPVSVRELTGAERERVWKKQTDQAPFFADYVDKLAGVRTIPVLALTRA